MLFVLISSVLGSQLECGFWWNMGFKIIMIPVWNAPYIQYNCVNVLLYYSRPIVLVNLSIYFN